MQFSASIQVKNIKTLTRVQKMSEDDNWPEANVIERSIREKREKSCRLKTTAEMNQFKSNSNSTHRLDLRKNALGSIGSITKD